MKEAREQMQSETSKQTKKPTQKKHRKCAYKNADTRGKGIRGYIF